MILEPILSKCVGRHAGVSSYAINKLEHNNCAGLCLVRPNAGYGINATLSSRRFVCGTNVSKLSAVRGACLARTEGVIRFLLGAESVALAAASSTGSELVRSKQSR